MDEPCDEQYLPISLYRKIGTTPGNAYYNCKMLK